MAVSWNQKTVFDGASLGDAAPVFSRGVPTLDHAGRDVAADVPRYHERQAIAGRPVWTDTGITVAATGTVALRAAGVAHDGVTPVTVEWGAAATVITVRSGASLEVASSTTLAEFATALDAPASHSYASALLDVHHGLIVAYLARQVGGERVGITVAASQDLGVTWSYVQARDASGARVVGGAETGAGDIPDIDATGIDVLLNDWALGKFPKAGLRDTEGVYFTACDYQSRSGNPGGYQAMVFEASRSGKGLWTLRDNRLIGAVEIPGETGFHGHAASVEPGGLLVACGDVGNRNRFDFYAVDWSTYETGAVDASIGWHGSGDTGDDTYEQSPQPTSPCPWSTGTIWSPDETREMLVSAPVHAASDVPAFDRADRRYGYDIAGIAHAGHAPLHLRWTQRGDGGGVWYGGSGDDTPAWYHLSTDGATMARLHVRGGGAGNTGLLFSDGTLLYRVFDRNIWTAPVPAVRTLSPLLASPGGTNLCADAWSQRTSPHSTNSVRRVLFAGGEYRYESDGALLAPQPEASPALYGPIYELDYAGESATGGEFHVTPTATADRFTFEPANMVQVAMLGRGDTLLTLESRFRLLTTSFVNPSEGVRLWTAETSRRWTLFPSRATFSSQNVNRRGLVQLLSRVSGTPARGKALVQVQWTTGSDLPSYPIPANTEAAQPDETVAVPVSVAGPGSWTIGCALRWADDYNTTRSTNLMTVWGDAGNHVVVQMVESATDAGGGTYRITVTSGGVAASPIEIAAAGRPLPGDDIYLVLSSDGESVSASVSTNYGVGVGSVAAQMLVAPSRVQSGGALQEGMAPLGWYAVAASDDPTPDAQDIARQFSTLSFASTPETDFDMPTPEEIAAALINHPTAVAERDKTAAIRARTDGMPVEGERRQIREGENDPTEITIGPVSPE